MPVLITPPLDSMPVFSLMTVEAERFKVVEAECYAWVFDVLRCQLDLVVYLFCGSAATFTERLFD